MTRHTVLQGDVLTALAILPDSSVHCVVTSPPYFDQRDYRVDGQGGLQSTPGEYLEWLVSVCRDLRRVLRDDGTFWLNVGDGHATRRYDDPLFGAIKENDLIGIPWMLAFLLRMDGWHLRESCIWNKPNAKPTFCKNKPAASHEYIFLLAKSGDPTYWIHRDGRGQRTPPDPDYVWVNAAGEGVDPSAEHTGKLRKKNLWEGVDYFYDQEAVKEPLKHPEAQGQLFGGKKFPGNVPNATYSGKAYDPSLLTGRNKQTVWTIPTAGYRGRHTAVFPEELPRICIKAGTSEYGCCPACGAPYRRIVATGEPDLAWQQACGGNRDGEYRGTGKKDYTAAKAEDASSIKARILKNMCRKETVGWEPTCTCSLEAPVPCTVLDPFSGSGTTALVSRELRRNSLGIELNPDSIQETRERLGIATQATLDTGAVEYEFLVVE